MSTKQIRKLILSLFGTGGAVWALPTVFQGLGMASEQAVSVTESVATLAAFLVIFGVDHIFGKRASERDNGGSGG